MRPTIETSRWRLRQFGRPALALALAIPALAQPTLAAQRGQVASRARATIAYKNTQYGFSLTMPESWKGYRVLWSEWEGNVFADDGAVTRTFRGPQLKIRHPNWNEVNPREDMPIMIFTVSQWNEHPVVSAAPLDPAELGRNDRYVFAVPPRWDYDFAEGWEEAQKILVSGSLRTFAPSK